MTHLVTNLNMSYFFKICLRERHHQSVDGDRQTERLFLFNAVVGSVFCQFVAMSFGARLI